MTILFNLEDYEVSPPRPIDPYWNELVLDCSGKVEDNGQVTLFYDSSEEPPDPDDFQDRNDFEVAWSEWEKLHPDFKPAMSPVIDVLEELPVQGWHFQEGKVYWHSSRNSQFKITKLFNTVSKAQGYFAGEIIKVKVCLSELLPLENKFLATLPEQSNSVLEKSKINQWVEPYYVNRGGNKYWYYRYCYYQSRIKHIHIPGGNTSSDKCLEIKERVERAIALGKSPNEIQLLIKPVAA
ncbi:hypothetical protein FJR11_06325 [Anabaena sp. UHCC 0187]|uniref:hypothetical protein n=1 Tax=Anabaena sp. UHCC 0187 TaxID=2590018 RepID=UPI001447DDF6|nr:hypothetical protein [Anabaena sp. UHCC 0187]MTJ12217.1 hypothetical protein [Anabaena sp. UHCC 0187]